MMCIIYTVDNQMYTNEMNIARVVVFDLLGTEIISDQLLGLQTKIELPVGNKIQIAKVSFGGKQFTNKLMVH